MNKKDASLKILEEWYQALPLQGGFPVRGGIVAALQVLETLKSNYSLDPSSHLTGKRGQVKDLSGPFLAKVLQRFGENRPFVKEGGRTNRGVIGYVISLLSALETAQLGDLETEDRNKIIDALQLYLVGKVHDYHGQQRIEVEYDPSKTTWQTISELLAKAKETNKEGPVAQYLVGAKLTLRFPNIEIGNESFSTADDQLKRPGDFYVGDTAFHVTVSPMPAVYEKCYRNIQQGFRVYLLVADRRLQGTKGIVTDTETLRGKVSVESIETFISQNLDELAVFKKDDLITGFRRLLETYNKRVDSAETDKSMMVEIPKNI